MKGYALPRIIELEKTYIVLEFEIILLPTMGNYSLLRNSTRLHFVVSLMSA